MRNLINFFEKFFTILLVISYFVGIGYSDFGNTIAGLSPIYEIIFVVIIILLCLLTVMTCIIDIIKIKDFELKYSIIKLILVITLLLNIYRPFIDKCFIKLLNSDVHQLKYSIQLSSQNSLLITIFLIILFILNFKSYKKSKI